MTEHGTEHGQGFAGTGAVTNSIEQLRINKDLPQHEDLQKRVENDRIGLLTSFVLAVALLGVTLYFGMG